MFDEELLESLKQFGAPFLVPRGVWRVFGVDRTGSAYDAVNVFNEDGSLLVMTEAQTRPVTPISIDVLNVQAATLNSAQAVDRDIRGVVVEERHVVVTVDGSKLDARALVTWNSFNLWLALTTRRVFVAGRLGILENLGLVSVGETTAMTGRT